MAKYMVLLDDPYTFFRKKKENMKETAIYLAVMIAIFTILNEASVRAGITKYIPKVGILESLVINFLSILAGMIFLAVILAVFTKSVKKSLFLIAYSFTPMFLLAWIPFIAISMASIVWSLFSLMSGLHIKFKFSHRKALFIVLALLAASITMIVISQNKIVPIIPTI